MLQRKLRYLASMLAVSAIAAVGLTLASTKPVWAEFQIQEAGIEKGEVELEYRGAYHWGAPTATGENENANDLVQSHELELQKGINDWSLIQVTSGLDQPLGENSQASTVELEAEFAMIKREGDGVALSFQAGYEQAINNHKHLYDAEANDLGFGPIVVLAEGSLLLTLNPLFTKQIGTYADRQGLGFEYGSRGEYDFAKHWGVGVEMFGGIEDLANQVPSIGPTLFYTLGGGGDEAKGGDDGNKAKAGDNDDAKGTASGPPDMEFSMNVGLQFGLTDVTSHTALIFRGPLSF